MRQLRFDRLWLGFTVRPHLLVALGAAASALLAASSPNSPAVRTISVAQLQQAISSGSVKTDAELAQQLSGFELTERLSSMRLAQSSANLPGEKSRDALLLLSDRSVFLQPPGDEIPAQQSPDAARARQMLTSLVNYVNTTLRQLPNLIATRETTAFEDRPAEDALEPTGTVSYSYLPLHVVGKSTASVTFRDRKEVVEDGGKSSKQGGRGSGLTTTGEFGPILSTVLGDALKGRITWARWEQSAKLTLAVFHYEVPEDKSNYQIAFCCIVNGYDPSGQPELQPFDEKAGYEGEIRFDPAEGTIYQMTLQSKLPPHALVSNAGMMVEYAPAEIAGRSYMCPTKSVSILRAHVYQPHGMYSQTDYRGPAKTFLNDVAFSHYRRFGSETRILTGANATP